MSDGPHVLRARSASADSSELAAPSVGVFTPSVSVGDLVAAGQSVGTLDVLGVQRALRVPDGTSGRVTRRIGGGRARVPVEFGDALITVSIAAIADASPTNASTGTTSSGALSFDAPMSGRFYSRPSPTEPPFIAAGDKVTRGQTVGLLEVMKTFNRLVYQGEALPAEATVDRIVPSDGDDVVRGDPILLLDTSGD